MVPTGILRTLLAFSVAAPSVGLLCAEEGDKFIKEAEAEEKIDQAGLSEEDLELAKKFRTNVYLIGIRRSDVLMHLVMSDEELWDWLPHAVNGKTLPRCAPGHDYARGCPIHGKYSGDQRQTWNWSPKTPYKVQCRTGDEWLPTNDYGAYVKGGMKEKLDCTQKYVDDGRGTRATGKPHWCAAAANFFLYSYIIQLRTDLTACWKQSGSPIFLHKAMIVYASIARDYPLMDYGRQNVGAHPPWWLGKMTCWGCDDVKLADYFNDKEMWAAVEKDEELKAFLKSRGIEGDLKGYFFKNIMMELHDACLAKNWFLSQGIGGERFQYIVQRWDNEDPGLGPTNESLAKQADGVLWRHFYNDMYRDGINTEIAASYGLMGQNQATEIISERVKQDQPFPKTPRLRNILCGSVRLIVIDKFLPSIGDSPFCPYTPGTGRGSAMTGSLARGGKGTGEGAGLKLGVSLFKDETVARWLRQRSPEEIEEKDDLALGSRVLTAYGLGVLESGKRGNRRAVTMFWGPGGVGSHAHSDMLNLEFFAFGKTLAPDLGYPEETGTPAKRQAWTSATISHSTVAVDRRSSGRVFGSLNCFKTLPGFHTVDVSSEQSVFGGACPPERVFRRQLSLVDIDEDRFYVVDAFRVRGGSQHDWIFHANHKEDPGIEGPVRADKPKLDLAPKEEEKDEVDELMDGVGEGEKQKEKEEEELPADFVRRVKVETKGLELSDPKEWRLLHAYQQSIKKAFRGSEYLHYPQLGKPADLWSVTWDAGDDVKVRLTMLKGCAQEVILADGEPPYRMGAPKFLKYVLARNEGEELRSNYVGFLEAYRGQPAIQRVTDLRTEEDSWSDVAVRVETADRQDHFFSSIGPGKLHRYAKDLQFRGSQGFISESGGQVTSVCLIGIDRSSEDPYVLEARGFRIEISSRIGGRVEGIDPDAGTFVTASEALHQGLVGEVMVFGNERHQCAYRVDGLSRLEDGKWRVQLEADLVVGISPLRKIEDHTALLGERISTYGGRFAGMTLSNEDGSSLWRIVGSEMTTEMTKVSVATDGPPLDPEAIQDRDGDLERCLKVCDFGPGDAWSIPVSAHLSRGDDGYAVRTNAPTKVTLPKGTRLSLLRPDGPAEPLSGTTVDGRDVFEIRPGTAARQTSD